MEFPDEIWEKILLNLNPKELEKCMEIQNIQKFDPEQSKFDEKVYIDPVYR